MSNYDHILNNINKSSIDLSTSNKYDEIIELYKMIVVKLIMSCELTLYKICSANNLTNNLKQNVVYEHINIFLQKKNEHKNKRNRKDASLARSLAPSITNPHRAG